MERGERGGKSRPIHEPERFFFPPSKVKSSKLQRSWLEGGHECFYDAVNWRLGIKYV